MLIIFLVVIAVPGAMLFVDTGQILPGDNRMAASFPKLIKEDGSLAKRKELLAFVDDNIGFRTSAPKLDDMVMYTMFGTTLDNAQLMGKEGNLFAGDDRRFPARRAPYPPLTEKELAENGRNIQAASDYFKSKEIPFLFITIPNKEEVYPLLYNDKFIQRPDKTRLAQQVEWMIQNNTGVDAYDMTLALRDQAESFDGMLWYETKDNAHWNYAGAWYGYLEIMDRLKAYNAELEVLSLDDFEISTKTSPYMNFDGSFAYKGLSNTVYTYDYKPGFRCKQIDYRDDPWMPKEQLREAGFQEGGVYFHFYNEEEEGTLVFFGDSYVYQFLLPYFSESFEHVYLFHLPTNYTIMKPILDMIGADYVILEMVERTYGTTDIDKMEKQFLAKAPVLELPEDYPE